ncbi:MAG: peptide chain release factor N(5)-glutamine methyltransferase [Fimbriimonadales bacterium]
MTVARWLEPAQLRLEGAGIESPALEAQMLAAHAILADRTYVITHPDAEFPELAGEQLLQRRESHEPLAYILGWREFYSRRFRVGPGVLVPRQETETLVDAALSFLDSTAGARVLDLGTGSGCIAITIKLERPGVDVTASDVSEEALEIARSNAGDLAADVRFELSDGFGSFGEEHFDLIVTNPPYVGLHEALPLEVLSYEPAEALFSGHTGLEFYEMLAETAAEHLTESGKLMMEVGFRQARQVALIFESCGWGLMEVVKDLSGVERVVAVQPLVV